MKKLLVLSILIITQFNLPAQEKFRINFDFGKFDLTALAKKKLDSFLTVVPTSSIMFIWLDGHTDFVGNDENNDRLSLNRVNTTKQYILSKGIPDSVFRIKAHGKREPLNENADDHERFLNRRVELSIERRIEEPQQQPPNPVVEIPELPAPMKKEETLTKIINDSATKEGTNIILRNMNFIGGRHVLLPGSVGILEELLQGRHRTEVVFNGVLPQLGRT